MFVDLDEKYTPDPEHWKRELEQLYQRLRTVNPETLEMQGIFPLHDYTALCPGLSNLATKGATFTQK